MCRTVCQVNSVDLVDLLADYEPKNPGRVLQTTLDHCT